MKNVLPLLILPLASNIAVAQEKPNILWITIEDTSPQFIGCYGNKEASTPVIDRLANEGIRFTNAFSTGTVCSPSRTAIITGVKTYETGTGNHRSKYKLPSFIKGFPYYMQQEGYYVTNNVKTDYNVDNESGFIKETWNASSDKASYINRKPGQPFFAVFNYIDSHQSRTMTESYDWYISNVLDKLPTNQRIAENKFQMPPFYLDSPEMRKHHARVYNSIKLTDNKIGELLGKLEKDGLRDSTIIFFFADHGEGIPNGKTNGINLGYRVPFVVWFPEMYQHLSPWGKAGSVSDELICFEDLASSMVSLAGGNIPNHITGRVLIGKNRSEPVNHLNLSNDRADNGIDLVRSVTDGKYMYSRNFMPFMPSCRYIRYMEIGEIKQQMREDLKANKLNELQKSLFDERPAEYLYDIENDVWETKNLANDRSYKKILNKMREQLNNEIIQSRDVMLLPEYQIGLISQTGNAYEYRLDNAKYPISKIYEAAALSGFRNKKVASKQIKLLTNENEIVRYWTILGLRSQSSTVLEKYTDEISTAMKDAYPPVAITASAIQFQLTGNKTAEEKLKNFCKNENQELALMTINYLLYIDNKLPFVETIKLVHKNKASAYQIKAACMDVLGSMGLVPNNMEYRE